MKKWMQVVDGMALNFSIWGIGCMVARRRMAIFDLSIKPVAVILLAAGDRPGAAEARERLAGPAVRGEWLWRAKTDAPVFAPAKRELQGFAPDPEAAQSVALLAARELLEAARTYTLSEIADRTRSGRDFGEAEARAAILI